ncbi:hypothetical protein QOZ80_3BG0270440 [Eleusine coracana subsp. coracana]|nr:hypothetical protein QOZ80_3BG0270440 [Eleusine coracana subsp. coracana]
MHTDGFARMLLLRVVAMCQGSKVEPAAAMAVMPILELADSSHSEHLEEFSHYVARQMGFQDINECPQLCILANNYLKNIKNCIHDIYGFFVNVQGAEALYVQFIEELDKCILGYFAFHWDHATELISQALTVDSSNNKWRKMALEATRKQRFERVTRDLKVTRVFTTLVEEMKAIGITGASGTCDKASQYTEVMAPVGHSERSPVLLLMGGGMGAGKSTVLKEILQEPFWSNAEENVVIVEADAFKETDVIYRAISSMGHHNDMLQTAELVHKSSTDAASSLLVTALNEGRDVILDGTLSWEPFVEQTIAMARAIHRQRYRMGVGYKADAGTENYWEPDDKLPPPPGIRRPYRIEVVGVICDAYLAVARGIRRAIITGRAVRVKSQLQSHKRFAAAFQRYSQLVDGARLYSTNSMGSAQLIAWKDGNSSLLVEPREFACLEKVSNLNENATSIHDLYPDGTTTCGSRSIWEDMVVSPSRAAIQRELHEVIRSLETINAETATAAT